MAPIKKLARVLTDEAHGEFRLTLRPRTARPSR